MITKCPIHGETEGYDTVRGGYFGKCKLCTREKTHMYRLQKARGTFKPKARVYATEPVKHVYDPWLTCNQCGKVCTNGHSLFVHKRTLHSTTGSAAPELQSLLQSALRQR